jgi:hypothetical protein
MTELGITGQEYSPLAESVGAVPTAVVCVMNSRVRHESLLERVGLK